MLAADADDFGDICGVDGMRGESFAPVAVVLAVGGDEDIQPDRINQRADFRGQGAGAAACSYRGQHARLMQGAEGRQHRFGHKILPFAEKGVVNVEENDFGGHGGVSRKTAP